MPKGTGPVSAVGGEAHAGQRLSALFSSHDIPPLVSNSQLRYPVVNVGFMPISAKVPLGL